MFIFLIETSIFFHIYVSPGGMSENVFVAGVGECIDNRKLMVSTDMDILKCPSKRQGPPKSGNYIGFRIIKTDRWTTMDLVIVSTTFCQPKPEQCRCSTLLEYLLREKPEINRIDGYFAADPPIIGCKCYLGAAAKQGFKFVKLKGRSQNLKKKCTGIHKLTVKGRGRKKGYRNLCKYLNDKQCFGPGEITKLPPDQEDPGDY